MLRDPSIAHGSNFNVLARGGPAPPARDERRDHGDYHHSGRQSPHAPIVGGSGGSNS
jgi:hypothetical protein